MFLLTKVFQLRDKANPDHEKPFLEHLEDLRITITRMALVLLVASIACFMGRNHLMDIIKKPVTDLYESRQHNSLKDLGVTLDTATWDIAVQAARDASLLTPGEREAFYQSVAKEGQDLQFHVRSIIYFRAALAIPMVERRDAFVDALPDLDEKMRKQVHGLLKGMPSADVDARGRLVLMQALNPTEGFMLSIKLAFFAGIVISFPFLLFFLLQFTLPGLHEKERRALYPAMVVGFGLFLAGVFFAYYGVLPRVLEFFHNYSQEMGIRNEWRIGYYISFATQFTLIFGLAFELPVVVMTLVKLGIMNYEMMKKTRSYAILAIFVIAAIITPTPDAFTLCLLAVPMIILYEICIWLAYFSGKKERALEEAEEKARLERLLAVSPKPASGTEAVSDDDENHLDEHPDDHDHYDHDQYHDDHPDDHDHDEHDPHHHDHDGHADEDPHRDRAKDDGPLAPELDFHEEADPGQTEEGEGEDISDPWPKDSEASDESEQSDDDDPHSDDTPEEEKNR
ncbi:MAG: twin-arginine translocase subunit TatC [Verrucomicrobia bacterium]|nr:twin-arginine translocase subunit TatC [Verrucomicrobiota bacterium]MDA1006755.1 twin-arginine translocase subunit TatC [Verrucomicrobiota bacterium]